MKHVSNYNEFNNCNEAWRNKPYGNINLDTQEEYNALDNDEYITYKNKSKTTIFFDEYGKLNKRAFINVLEYDFGYTTAFTYKFLANKKTGNVGIAYGYTEHSSIFWEMLGNNMVKGEGIKSWNDNFYGYLNDNEIGIKNAEDLTKKKLDIIISNLTKATAGLKLKLNKKNTILLLGCTSSYDDVNTEYEIKYKDFNEFTFTTIPIEVQSLWSSYNLGSKSIQHRLKILNKETLANLGIKEYSEDYQRVLKLIRQSSLKIKKSSSKLPTIEYKHKSTKYKFTESLSN